MPQIKDSQADIRYKNQEKTNLMKIMHGRMSFLRKEAGRWLKL
jgi:hypothetical protein